MNRFFRADYPGPNLAANNLTRGSQGLWLLVLAKANPRVLATRATLATHCWLALPQLSLVILILTHVESAYAHHAAQLAIAVKRIPNRRKGGKEGSKGVCPCPNIDKSTGGPRGSLPYRNDLIS